MVLLGCGGKYILIFTSYFANLRKIPKNVIPISICLYPPKWYNGLSYTDAWSGKNLAPKPNIFFNFKRDMNRDFYTKDYNAQLSTLDADKVVADLYNISGDKDVVLICYEKPSDFCHRHLVADWLVKNGYNVTEYENK